MTRLLIIYSALLFTACNSSNDKQEKKAGTEKNVIQNNVELKQNSNSSALIDNYVEFYLNGDENLIKKEAMARWELLNGKPFFTITNNGHLAAECKNSVVFEISNDKPEEYSFDNTLKSITIRGKYWPNCEVSDNWFDFNMGKIKIISYDGSLLNATFEGSAKNAKTGELFSISKGKVVNAKVTKVAN